MRLTGHDAIRFDGFLPVYNWIYPLCGDPVRSGVSAPEALAATPRPVSRALYLHVPFCETICTFCPFVRTARHDADTIELYVRALIREIELKAAVPALADAPIGAVFVGGGTPSVLSPGQLRRVGRALRAGFDLSRVREFSFELEVKSVTPDRLEALRDIGVTHARFGAQTFDPALREHFGLTATLDDLDRAARLLRAAFPTVSCDLLFGAAGHAPEDLLADLAGADALGLDNIDLYPINNLVTQPRLDRRLAAAGRAPTSGLTRHYLRLFGREALRELGFLPHNGHGFVRVGAGPAPADVVVTDAYSFVYHEHTLGYPDHDLLGFGLNAISSFRGSAAHNTSSMPRYLQALGEGALPARFTTHGPEVDAARPLALALPYHGSVPTSWIDEASLEPAALDQLDQLVRHDLVRRTDTHLELTLSGWEWYTHLTYVLLPDAERRSLDRAMAAASARKPPEPSGLEGFVLPEATGAR